jgi:hypothetical protein
MIPSNDASGDPGNEARQRFTDAFVRNAHLILLGGYLRLNAPDYRSSEEDEITGDLAREMMSFIATASEPWMQNCRVHDQHPVTAAGGPASIRRVGKRRPKIDLQFVAYAGQRFHRFSWEAKRLGKGHAIGDYLGEAGLGCFLSGQYSSECAFGGMLGYAQSGELADRMDELRRRLGKSCVRVESQLTDFPTSSLVSSHHRPSLKREITIYHTLLRFS